MSAVPTSPPTPAPTDSGVGALVRLAVFVAGAVTLAALLHGLAVLLVVAALVVMVMLHELGHFVTAKLSGMKVTEYFFGFGPRLWSFRRGETEYGVKAIPAGGYVRIVGMTTLEEVDPEDEARSYRQATFPRRLTVGLAGSAMHFVIAFGLLWGMLAFTGVPVPVSRYQVTGLTSFTNHANPAAKAGVRPGDVLVAADGHHFATLEGLVTFIEDHAGDKISLTVQRDGRLVTLSVTPIDGRAVDVSVNGGAPTPAKSGSKPIGVIGVALGGSQILQTTTPWAAVPRAGAMLGRLVAATGSGIATVFSAHGIGAFAHDIASARTPPSPSTSSSGSTGTQNQGELLSLPGAVDVAVQGLHQSVSELLYILVAINLFVGMANLFPMLPLDGGHVAIAVYERVRSRRGRIYHADVRKMMPFAYLFLAGLVLLGLGALYVNIFQPPVLPHS